MSKAEKKQGAKATETVPAGACAGAQALMEERIRRTGQFRSKIWGQVYAGGEGVNSESRTADIDAHGIPGESMGRRRALLHGLGIIRKSEADHGIMWGCGLFGMPMQAQSLAKVFDKLGVKFTFIRSEGKEYCCNWPAVESSTTVEERIDAEKGAATFMKKNVEALRSLGAKDVTYFCTWCAYVGKYYVPEYADSQHHILDVLLEKLENTPMAMARPTTIAWYEGCHQRNKLLTPGVDLRWGDYRKVLDRIKNLKIVELRHKTCCVFNGPRLVEDAVKTGASAVITPCAPCWTWLDRASHGRIAIKHLPDLIAEALPDRDATGVDAAAEHDQAITSMA